MPDASQSSSNPMARLIDHYLNKRKMPRAHLTEKARIDPATFRKNHARQDDWRLAHILAIVKELGIPHDEVVEAIFPGTSASISQVTHLQRMNDRLTQELTDAREGRAEPQSVIREVLRSGNWAVSAIPVFNGPTADHRALVDVRLAISPHPDPDPEGTIDELRRLAEEQLPGVMRRAVVVTGTDDMHVQPPALVSGSAGRCLQLSVPIFSADSEPLAPALRHQFMGGPNEIVVVSTSVQSHPQNTAAIVARSLGWGLRSTHSTARAVSRGEIASGAERRAWNRREAHFQLRNTLASSDRPTSFVYAHWGYTSVEQDGQHPLLQAIDTARENPGFIRLPFVVLLTEDDALLEFAATRRYQESTGPTNASTTMLDNLTKTRDALRTAVSAPELAGRALVIPVRSSDAQRGGDSKPRDHWLRASRQAKQVIDHFNLPPSFQAQDATARLFLDGAAS